MTQINNEDIKSTITTLVSKVDEDITVIQEYILNRLYELCEISKQKGINDFGWKGPVPDDDYDNYDDDEEYLYDDFCDSQFSFIIMDDFSYQTHEYLITRFRFDYDRNELIGTEYFDDNTRELQTGRYIRFTKTDKCNWRTGYYLVKMIEQELGVE